MRTMREILAEQPFLADLSAPHLDLLAGCAGNTHFEAGALVLHEGDPATTFYLLTHGRAALEVFVPGRGPHIVHTIEAGEALGWSWLFPPYRVRYDARALEPVRAVALDGACLRGKATGDHDLGYELLRRFGAMVVEQLESTRLQLVDVYAHARAR